MKNLIYFFLAVAFVFTFSCTNVPKVNPETELQSLRQATNGMIEGITLKEDINRFMDFFDLKAELFYLDSIFLGKEEVRKRYATAFSNHGLSFSGVKIHDVQVAKAGDLGYTILTYDIKMIQASGEQMKMQGINLLIWEKQADGSWKVRVDKE